MIQMVSDDEVYPKQPVWELDNPCTEDYGKPIRLWTCLSRQEIHIIILKFLYRTLEVKST